jgi:hypothetical protein
LTGSVHRFGRATGAHISREVFAMLRVHKLIVGLLIGLNGLAAHASAQFMFPTGYSRFGMSEWGANPAAGTMAGMGAFARGKGSYLLDKAKADAINVETMTKWNKALRARQLAIREDQEKEAARREAARKQRVERSQLNNGTTLNNLLTQIFAFDPTVAKAGRSNTPLSMRTIREIPFEWDSEAISLCLDQMTGKRSLPASLMVPAYDQEREALQAAVHTALDEDAKGTVSMETVKRINDAVSKLRRAFTKNTSRLARGYDDALTYLATVATLSRLLNDPSMKRFLAELKGKDERTVGELIAFMDSYNLRFGPATTSRQLEIYKELVPILTEIRDSMRTARDITSPPDPTGEGLKEAALEAFNSMKWEDLEAHAREQ